MEGWASWTIAASQRGSGMVDVLADYCWSLALSVVVGDTWICLAPEIMSADRIKNAVIVTSDKSMI